MTETRVVGFRLQQSVIPVWTLIAPSYLHTPQWWTIACRL